MNTDSTRIIALKLHALHAEDRQWILSRLPVDSQVYLAPLLDELNDLGLELNLNDIESINSKSQPGAIALSSTDAILSADNQSNNELMAMVDSASSEQIAEIFQEEPSVFFECLKSSRQWNWLPDLKLRENSYVHKRYESRPTLAVKLALIKATANQLSELNISFSYMEKTSSLNPDSLKSRIDKLIKNVFSAK